jgi:hypothetical protein
LLNARHLRISLLFTGITTIFLTLNNGLSLGIGGGLSFGLSYWCLLGLFQGIAQEQVEDQDRRIANQGIHRSLRNSVIMGIVSGTIIGSIGLLKYGLSLWLIRGLNDILRYGLSLGPIPVLSFVLNYGLKVEQISSSDAVMRYGLFLGICGALLIYILTGGLAVWRHYVIRFLLWRAGIFPGQAPQFLDNATTRFLLRRVGGGYSFTHRLLLDHLADDTLY